MNARSLHYANSSNFLCFFFLQLLRRFLVMVRYLWSFVVHSNFYNAFSTDYGPFRKLVFCPNLFLSRFVCLFQITAFCPTRFGVFFFFSSLSLSTYTCNFLRLFSRCAAAVLRLERNNYMTDGNFATQFLTMFDRAAAHSFFQPFDRHIRRN